MLSKDARRSREDGDGIRQPKALADSGRRSGSSGPAIRVVRRVIWKWIVEDLDTQFALPSDGGPGNDIF